MYPCSDMECRFYESSIEMFTNRAHLRIAIEVSLCLASLAVELSCLRHGIAARVVFHVGGEKGGINSTTRSTFLMRNSA